MLLHERKICGIFLVHNQSDLIGSLRHFQPQLNGRSCNDNEDSTRKATFLLKMPLWIATPESQQLLRAEPLEHTTFSQFGDVIANPAPHLVPSPNLKDIPDSAVLANQGSAIKHLDVTKMQDLYTSAPSTQQAKAVMNMFVCAPRQLSKSTFQSKSDTFSVKILERHPFTTQTFIPLGLSLEEAHEARYLVIVAPTLAPSPSNEALPVPPSSTTTEQRLPGRGLPDLTRLRAFIANGSQAVTYGAGTWHAPMVVIGQKLISFVVVQFANGVGIEDCQEVEWDNNGKGRIEVSVPLLTDSSSYQATTGRARSKL